MTNKGPTEDFSLYLKNLLELFIQKKQENRSWEGKMTGLLSKLSICYEQIEQRVYGTAIDPKISTSSIKSQNYSNGGMEPVRSKNMKKERVYLNEEEDPIHSQSDVTMNLQQSMFIDPNLGLANKPARKQLKRENDEEVDEWLANGLQGGTQEVPEGHECNSCYRSFNTSPALLRHVQRNHPEDVKPKSTYEESEPVYQEMEPVYQELDPVYQELEQAYQEPQSYDVKPIRIIRSEPERRERKLQLRRERRALARANSEPVQCDQCDVQLSHSASLVRHLAEVHSNKEATRCKFPLCTYESNVKKRLTRHYYNVHEKREDFLCAKCPNFRSRSASYLKEHVRFHHENVYDHACKFCHYCAITSPKLRKHVKAVHDIIRDEKCTICPQTFSTSYNMQLHIKTVHERFKAFHCDQCVYETNKKKYLGDHMRRKHPAS